MIAKETYFSTETIDNKAIELLSNTNNILGQLKKHNFTPKESALIVIDMQDFFCCPSSHAFIPSSLAIIPKIKLLIDSYKKENLPVIFTKHVNTPKNAGLMGTWWKDIISYENEMNEIIPEFETKNSYVITKTQYDAFYNTDLEKYLRKYNIKKLIITGVMTHLCCETTARSAFSRGFETFLPIDTTATYNEDFHAATILNLSHGFSFLTYSGELVKKIIEINSNDTQ